MRRTLIALLATSVVLLTPGVATAGSSSKSDPDDTQSRLDIKRVSLKTQGRKIVATVSTHDAFTDDDLRGGPALGVDFKVSKKKVRGIAIRATGSGPVAEVCTYRPKGPVTGTNCAAVSVKRMSGTAIRITVLRAQIDKGAKTYRWRGGSFAPDGSAGCTTSPHCLDTMGSGPKSWFTLKA